MKKPEYMDIEFPAVLKDFKSAVRKYFLGLKSQKVEIHFSDIRRRKDFVYKILFVCNETIPAVSSGKKTFSFVVEFLKDNSKK